MTSVDPKSLRAAFGSFMTGVTVVTTCDTKGVPVGFTANSFTSVSMGPPLLLVCPGRFLSSFEVFRGCQHFGVSVLAEGQEGVSNTFASFKGDRFAEVSWTPNSRGVPLIDGAVAQFSCRTERTIDAGDHAILLGEVLTAEVTTRPGLGYVGGQYFSLGLERSSADASGSDQNTVVGAIIEHDGKVLLRHTQKGLSVPTLQVRRRDGLRHAVLEMLENGGLQISLGATYSIYDDRGTGQRHVYILGRASSPATGGFGDWQPIETLRTARFEDPAIAAMLTRYAEEYQSRTFGLYIGDNHSGDLAPLQERT